jgi:protoporphyrinogen/coproporphyrinogen III oxidase
VQRAVARYQRVEQRFDFEGDRTFAAFLGPLPSPVRDIFSCAAHRAAAELDELSAGCGIGLFALVWGGKRSLIARNLPGGSGRLPAALGRELGGRARTGCRVHDIRPDGADLVVRHDDGEVSARHVIVAAQAPHAAPLVARVAAQTAVALSQLTYGAFVSLAVETSETTPMPYDDLYAMATPGRAFDMFTNQAHTLRGGPRRPGGSLMLFAGARGAAALIHEPDELIVDRFLADLHELYPQTRGAIAGVTVQRWELGNVYARPGRSRLQAALEGPLGAHENLYLAGDYFAELGNIEAAARAGLAAAERVDTRIREVTHA